MKIQCPSCGFSADSDDSKIPEQGTATCPRCKVIFSVSHPSSSQRTPRKISCPKCNREQDAADACQHCGLIFEKYKPLVNSPQYIPTTPTPSNLQVYCQMMSGISAALLMLYSLTSLALIMSIANSAGYRSGHFEGYGIEFFIVGAVALSTALFYSYRQLKSYATEGDININSRIVTATSIVVLSLLSPYAFSPFRVQILITVILMIIVTVNVFCKKIGSRTTSIRQGVLILLLIIMVIAAPIGGYMFYREMSWLPVKESPKDAVVFVDPLSLAKNAPCPIVQLKKSYMKFEDIYHDEGHRYLFYKLGIDSAVAEEDRSRAEAYRYAIRFRFTLVDKKQSTLSVLEGPAVDTLNLSKSYFYLNNFSTRVPLDVAKKTTAIFVTFIVSASPASHQVNNDDRH